MKTYLFILTILFYNLLFLAIAYKSIENELALQYLRREGERLQAAQEVQYVLTGLNYELVCKIILGCIIVGLVCYGVNSVNSTFQDSILVKGYHVGNKYLVSILDYCTGVHITPTGVDITPTCVDMTPTVFSDQSQNIEVPTLVNHIGHDTTIGAYTPHVITPDQGLEFTNIQDMSSVGDHLTQLGLW